MEQLLTLLSNYAFPVVCCIALFWKLDKDEERHRAESDNMREALENNTKVLTELATILKIEANIQDDEKGA